MAEPGRPARRPRTRAERGVSTIEFALLTPVIIAVVFATVQFAMFFFARHVAIAAAQAGARVARAEAQQDPGHWRADAHDKAMGYVQQLGPRLLEGVVATPVAPPGGQVVGVRVTGRVPKILLLDLRIDVTSQGPIERFVQDTP